MVPLLPLLWRSKCWAGVDLLRLLENFRKHSVELGYSLLTLIYGHLQESAYMSVKYGPLIFHVFPHKDSAFSHHLEVGIFPSNFIFSSVPGPLLRVDEFLGLPR